MRATLAVLLATAPSSELDKCARIDVKAAKTNKTSMSWFLRFELLKHPARRLCAAWWDDAPNSGARRQRQPVG